MSYEPTLLILKKDLDKHKDFLLNGKWQYDGSQDKFRGGEENKSPLEYLRDIYEAFNAIQIAGIELLLCTPEFSTFNREVRELLDELKVEYAKSY